MKERRGVADRGNGDDRICVLLVDDDTALVELTRSYLERVEPRIEAVEATSGPAGLAVLDERGSEATRPPVDCVVSDYDMGEMNGLDFLRAVREREPDLPFVLFTGKGSEEIASEAISAGVTDYLQKETGRDQYTVLANRVVNAVEHARSERAHRETEERYRTVVEGSHDAIYIYQGERFRFVNERACEITGYEREELYEMGVFDLVHPDDRERVRNIGRRRTSDGTAPSQYSARVLRKDGDVRHCEFSVSTVTYRGEPAVLGSVRDATAERRARERFRALIEHSMDIFTVLDESGEITYESPSAERVLGWSDGALVGDNVFEYIHEDDRQEAFETFTSVIDEPGFVTDRMTLRFRHADGSWRWLEAVGSNRTDTSIGGYVITSRDVTERVENERAGNDRVGDERGEDGRGDGG
ncbi:PAS domain S-box protein [Halobium salinum]|uniref:PAS domain S-box protein n=1 Tax=Halobium salinum TaxID=1364940 RepID=A0ABD5PE30_9EURY|nr:PAS domain S-box protein [Halobium salinum]